ncbi:MAG: cell division protein FtsI [Candidatus Eremiobacteraeota bacterium]|nr:cell division protein FtsI [Candidatus Eremiobacteraeota bacterium]
MEIKARMRQLSLVMLAAFLVPIFQLWNYQVYQQGLLETHPANPRRSEDLSLRGRILDRQGRVLAETRGDRRHYPLGPAAAALVGYYQRHLGRAGLELALDSRLQGRSRPRTLSEAMELARRKTRQGDDLSITLDAGLQQEVFQAMAGRRGAVVVLDVATGEVLAATTLPSFDPDHLAENWKELSQDENAPLIERASQGLYPPGSTFKVMMAAGLLEREDFDPKATFECRGALVVDGFEITDHGHGRVDLTEALVGSCNLYFADWGSRLGLDGIEALMARFELLDAPEAFPGSSQGHPPRAKPGHEKVAAAQAAIGQADMLVTPLAMARLAALVARGGLDIEPHLVATESRPERLLSEQDAALIGAALEQVVARGTATSVAGSGLAGKTGTAENPQGEPHAWFIGYAPAKSPRVAVAVILENGGYGGVSAAPLAAKAVQAALEHQP